MTISYSREVCNVRLCGFAKLLIRWRGSIYKLMFRESLIFLAIFYTLALIYRCLLRDNQRRLFESLVKYCNDFTDSIPVTFVLGFYINLVVKRWWEIYLELAWPDKALIKVSWLIKGTDERCRMIKRTLARYLNLIAILTYQITCIAVKKRFPTPTHLIDAGIMTHEEAKTVENMQLQYNHPSWWLPAVWYNLLLRAAVKEGYVDEGSAKALNDDMLEFRQKCANIWNYDWISVPLVYTQVVTWAVYSYIFASVMGRQFMFQNEAGGAFDVHKYFPVFTLLQFFFYVGWLKVAEQLVNPLGEDDDDFEVNWLIDRNLQTSFLIVDGISEHPPVVKDAFWNDPAAELPYTAGAADSRAEPFMGSANELTMTSSEMRWELPGDMAPLLKPRTDKEKGLQGEDPFEPERNIAGSRLQQLFNRMSSVVQAQKPLSTASSLVRMHSRLSGRSACASSRVECGHPSIASPSSSKLVSESLGRFQIFPSVSRQVSAASEDDVISAALVMDPRVLTEKLYSVPNRACLNDLRERKLSDNSSAAISVFTQCDDDRFCLDGLSPFKRRCSTVPSEPGIPISSQRNP